jgi:V8-like Glu-specific endopeptidase
VVRTSRDWWRLRASVVAVAFLGAFGVPQAAGAYELSQSPREVRDYWTDKRMASALPADALLEDIIEPASLLDGLGLGLAAAPTQRASAEEISNPSRAPRRTHGKVFFHQGLFDYVCSGTVVNSKNKSLVTTAGHCVHGDGSFVSNWMFVPGKDGSSEPFGRWVAKELATTPQWKSREDIRFDVGMATMAKRDGRFLQNVVGARGITFNRDGDQRFRAFGYPAGEPYDGRHLYVCKSRQQGTDQRMGKPRPARIACDQTGGSSGGGWIVGRGKVNSVVSYGYECDALEIVFPCDNPEKGKLFGPYFGNEIKKLYRSEKR